MKCPFCDGTGEVKATVGTLIGTARRAAGLTQAELAERTGIGRTSITNIEVDRQGVSAAKLIIIAKALGVPAGDLLP